MFRYTSLVHFDPGYVRIESDEVAAPAVSIRVESREMALLGGRQAPSFRWGALGTSAGFGNCGLEPPATPGGWVGSRPFRALLVIGVFGQLGLGRFWRCFGCFDLNGSGCGAQVVFASCLQDTSVFRRGVSGA